MIIRRKLFAEIEKYFSSRQIIGITGMRRVGKTTLLRYFFEKISSANKIFLDLEDPLNQAVFEQKNYEAIKAFFQIRGLDFSQKAYIFLDEIQLTPCLPSVVKYLYDHYQIKFFLTGSASFYLKNLFSESLAGRKYLFELFPLDFEEFLWFKNLKLNLPAFLQTINKQTHALFAPHVEEYLRWGGMPEVVLMVNSQEKDKVLRDIFSSYFQKEVQALGDFRKNEVVRNLILLLSKRVGQKVDLQRLASELEVSRQTLYAYLDFLGGTYFIYLLPALGEIDVAVRKQRKAYLIDAGLLSIFESAASGVVFENAVFNALRPLGKIYYFARGVSEIDFILKTSSLEKVAFEAKETIIYSDLKKVKQRAAKLGIKKAFCVSLNFSQEKGVKYFFQLPKL